MSKLPKPIPARALLMGKTPGIYVGLVTDKGKTVSMFHREIEPGVYVKKPRKISNKNFYFLDGPNANKINPKDIIFREEET